MVVKKMKDDIRENIYPALILTVIVLASASSLTATNHVTKDRIQEIREENINNMIEDHFPEMDDYEYKDDLKTYIVYEQESVMGYAFEASIEGYGGPIEILIALDGPLASKEDVNIKGISIIEHGETPGLGAKITSDSFKDQFNEVSLNDMYLSEEGGEIDSISGATISSTSVVKGVRESTKSKLSKFIEANK